jgi:hypothetical protein
MLTRTLFALLFVTTLQVFGQKPSDDFSGTWKTEDGIIINVVRTGGQFQGWVTDKKIIVLKELSYTKGAWRGTLINPKKGITAPCEAIKLDAQITFIVRKGPYQKKIHWTKVK